MPPLGLERAPALHAYVAAHNAETALRAGITSAVGANSPFDIDASLRDAIEMGLVRGPRFIPGSRDLITRADSNDTTPWWWESHALAGVRICDGPDEFRRAVRDEVHRGAEVMKLFPTGGHGIRLSGDTMSMTQQELNAAVEAAHGLGVRARAHVASKAGIMRCLEAEVDILDHGDGLDEECIKAIAETGTFLIPSIHNMAIHAGLGVDPNNHNLAVAIESFHGMCEILPAAMEAGVRICLGDDYGGSQIPHGTYGLEPGSYVKHASIPPLEVLRWATVNGGQLFGRDDLGRIEEGYLADIVVVDGDPSEDITVLGEVGNIHAVMRDGQLLVNEIPD